MANTKISALPPAAAITGTETVPLVQAGATKAATVSQLLALVVAGAPGNLDTFFETATRLGLDETTVATLQTLVASKADTTAVEATYLTLALQADGITYNSDGSVATSTLGGITTTYTYDANGNVATEARLGKTKTWSYDGSGNPTGSVIA